MNCQIDPRYRTAQEKLRVAGGAGNSVRGWTMTFTAHSAVHAYHEQSFYVAERRLGEMLRAMPKRGPEHSVGGGSSGSKREPLPDVPPTLADIGITKKLSMRAQQLAALPDEAFARDTQNTSGICGDRVLLPNGHYADHWRNGTP